MITWVICAIIMVCVVISAVLYAIYAPKHRLQGRQQDKHINVYVNDKGTTHDQDVYLIPYNRLDL